MAAETTDSGRPRTIRFAHRSHGHPFVWGGLPLPRLPADVLTAPTGAGVRIAVIDSGIEDLPLTAPQASMAIHRDDDNRPVIVDAEAIDIAGHGTLVGGIIRRIAPDCRLTSVRIFESGFRTHSDGLLAALEWAIDGRFSLINLSLSTPSPEVKEKLHDLADQAAFAGVTIVASAHNRPVRSFPWTFGSVISVGSHARRDPLRIEANPNPPVDFFGHGVDIPGIGSRSGQSFSGNSFATPQVTGLCALLLQTYPGMGTHDLRAALKYKSANVLFEPSTATQEPANDHS